MSVWIACLDLCARLRSRQRRERDRGAGAGAGGACSADRLRDELPWRRRRRAALRRVARRGPEPRLEQTLLNPFADAASAALQERCAPARYEARPCDSVLGLPGVRSWLDRRFAALRPDIVHVILFHTAVLTASVRRRGERRLLTHMYGEGLAQLPHPRSRDRLDRWAGRRFDHVSAISDAVGRFLRQRHGYPPPPVGRIRLTSPRSALGTAARSRWRLSCCAR